MRSIPLFVIPLDISTYFSSTYKNNLNYYSRYSCCKESVFFYDRLEPNLKEKLVFSISACQRENELSW